MSVVCFWEKKGGEVEDTSSFFGLFFVFVEYFVDPVLMKALTPMRMHAACMS